MNLFFDLLTLGIPTVVSAINLADDISDFGYYLTRLFGGFWSCVSLERVMKGCYCVQRWRSSVQF